MLSAALAAVVGAPQKSSSAGLDDVNTIVIIYAENRSFDNLYGYFPGANGLTGLTPAEYSQRDRDGSVFKELPPVWGGLTAKGVVPAVTQAETEHLAYAPFAIDDPKGFNLSLGVKTRDLWHRFYQNQMQIAGGKNDHFAAYADWAGDGSLCQRPIAAVGCSKAICAGRQLLYGWLRRLLYESF